MSTAHATPAYTLVMGNKNYSSWSLRPWFLLRQAGLPFSERVVALYESGYEQAIRDVSPSGKVPVLLHRTAAGEVRVWDSLAICEYLAELHPGLWPADPVARAMARSISAEMHSSFAALRNQFTCNVRRSTPMAPSPATRGDIDRIVALWTECRERYGAQGPFLFGQLSVADAMYAPICLRFRTYGVDLSGTAGNYQQMMLATPALRQLIRDAEAEPWIIARYEAN
ncbi:MAG: glutathione S-transferase family protein [Deltaproteobacteria bacterium]|nr:glutathione S-transferase family protein [Deltaproteobacteria bacterium]